jgi:iron complex transport system permease protein
LNPRTALLVLLGLWIVTTLGAPLVGSQAISLKDALSGDGTAATILWRIRLPRVLLAILAGGALAVSGLAFQTLFRNPLAEPYTLGVAGGAALGAVLAMQLEWIGTAVGFPAVAAAAFIGALSVSLVILGLAVTRFGVEVTTLLLAGIAISLSCSALILFLQYLADFTKTFRMVRWMMGGLSVVGYGEVLWVAPWVVVGGLALVGHRWDLNLLLTGEDLAASRGVSLLRIRLVVLGVTSAMIGALVSVTGPIGFVGLIVPHMLRRWVGHDHLFLIPICDLGARTIMAPAELPVGILTALLGGPFFLWLLIARR